MQFSQTVINQLRELWRDYLQRRSLGGKSDGGSLVVPLLYVAKIGGTAITAASGTTPGSGTVTLQTLSGSALANRTNAGGTAKTVTAYNFVETASGTNRYCFVCQDVDGKYWLVAEAC